MLFNFCYIIMNRGKAVQAIYSEFEDGTGQLRYEWTLNPHEALYFIEEPKELPPQSHVMQLPLYIFYHISFDMGFPKLKQSLPKPYKNENEFESIQVSKKTVKEELNTTILDHKDKLEKMKEKIDQLTQFYESIDWLQIEEI